jgi:hypothetical protein
MLRLRLHKPSNFKNQKEKKGTEYCIGKKLKAVWIPSVDKEKFDRKPTSLHTKLLQQQFILRTSYQAESQHISILNRCNKKQYILKTSYLV